MPREPLTSADAGNTVGGREVGAGGSGSGDEAIDTGGGGDFVVVVAVVVGEEEIAVGGDAEAAGLGLAGGGVAEGSGIGGAIGGGAAVTFGGVADGADLGLGDVAERGDGEAGLGEGLVHDSVAAVVVDPVDVADGVDADVMGVGADFELAGETAVADGVECDEAGLCDVGRDAGVGALGADSVGCVRAGEGGHGVGQDVRGRLGEQRRNESGGEKQSSEPEATQIERRFKADQTHTLPRKFDSTTMVRIRFRKRSPAVRARSWEEVWRRGRNRSNRGQWTFERRKTQYR